MRMAMQHAAPVPSPQAQRPVIQKKVQIGPVDDPLECEADRIADAVVSDRPVGPIGGSAPGSVQRIASHESPREEDAVAMPEEESRAEVQRKESDGSYFAPRYASGEFSQRLETRAGAGEPLDSRLRGELAPWFAGYLDGVRIHHGQEAGELAKQISARAFTTGRDIYFAPGEYRPKTTEGRRVLAHELAHVAQQADGRTESVAQRLSAPRRVKRRNVRPWGDAISGDNYEVETDGGTPISAWIAYSPWKIQYHYWCHGHSLGTFENHGYSVYSGDPMMKTVNQEWSPVSSGNTQSRDIAVWLPTYEHSCRIVSPSIANGKLDPNTTQVSSKNGQDPLVSTTLANIMTIYPGASPAFYRRR